MSTVRTRFAPSPTGYMHVGNLRTALYTYLQARHNGGTFILRIEDTDQGRLVEGATDIIYGTLKATGLTWDEGPDVGGPVGPYVQSQRMGMFKQYAEQLVATRPAWRWPTTPTARPSTPPTTRWRTAQCSGCSQWASVCPRMSASWASMIRWSIWSRA